MTKRNVSLVKKTIKDNDTLMAKLLLECWNAERPHFGGVGPHRYDGKDKNCCYCNRPKNWKPVNAGMEACLVHGNIND